MRLDRYLSLCIEEALRGIFYHRSTVAPAVIIITVSLTILGAFLLVSENLNTLLANWRQRGQVQIFLDQSVTKEQVEALQRELAANGAVEDFCFLSTDSAAELFRTDFQELGDVLALLEGNPLPPSFAVTIMAEQRSVRSLDRLTQGWWAFDGVDGVQYDLQIIRRLELGVRGIRLIGIILGTTVLLAAIITTSNAVRILVIARRREIELMRLVGSSEPLVRGRFLFEGALHGVVGGVAAIAILYSAFNIGISYLELESLGVFSSLPLHFLGLPASLGLVSGGAITGLAGSWFAFGLGGVLRT